MMLYKDIADLRRAQCISDTLIKKMIEAYNKNYKVEIPVSLKIGDSCMVQFEDRDDDWKVKWTDDIVRIEDNGKLAVEGEYYRLIDAPLRTPEFHKFMQGECADFITHLKDDVDEKDKFQYTHFRMLWTDNAPRQYPYQWRECQRQQVASAYTPRSYSAS